MKVFDVDFVVYWLQRHSGSEKKPAKRMAPPNSAKWKWLRAVLSCTHTAIDSTMPRWCHGFLFLGACSIQAAVGIDICQTMESTTLIQTRSVSSRTVSKSMDVGNQTVNKVSRANVSEDSPPTSFQTAVSQTIFGNRQTEHAVMIAVMLLVGIAAFELVHLDCTGVDLTSPFRLFDDVQRQQSQAKEGPFRGAMRLWKLYLTERWKLLVSEVESEDTGD
eukprot:s5473_g1.t1